MKLIQAWAESVDQSEWLVVNKKLLLGSIALIIVRAQTICCRYFQYVSQRLGGVAPNTMEFGILHKRAPLCTATCQQQGQ